MGTTSSTAKSPDDYDSGVSQSAAAANTVTRGNRIAKSKSKQRSPTWDSLTFTVDSALLRELGERLVGRPHIALAELVKNSYDADANDVEIAVEPDRIVVSDNGHGMDFREFKDFWMRIGSPHKQTQLVSRRLKRPLTGSKGVGRLSAQFLAKGLRVITVAEDNPRSQLIAEVNWEKAVKAGELTQATARYQKVASSAVFPGNRKHGTMLIMTGLNQRWADSDFQELANEIWWLQPPFRRNPGLTSKPQRAFAVQLHSPNKGSVAAFRSQMDAYLGLWHSRIVGGLEEVQHPTNGGERTVRLSLEFSDRTRTSYKFDIKNCPLADVQFEVRIFHLKYRQPFGLKVEDVRAYLNRYGGVHVYDAGFHLPYYGPDTDWLGIEQDHSHRLSKSRLLPDELQVSEGMNFLPTNSRILGVVHVDTSKERAVWSSQKTSDYLRIQISRDRLVDNEALHTLRTIVRTAVDFYAMAEAKRQSAEDEKVRDVEPLTKQAQRVEAVLERFKDQMPARVYATLGVELSNVVKAVERKSTSDVRQAGLLGALATAGISAIAYEHEMAKQYAAIESLARRIETLAGSSSGARSELLAVSSELIDWVRRGRETRALFRPLMEEENRTVRSRFKAKALIDQVANEMRLILRSTVVDSSDLDANMRLPLGTYAEWFAVFQNLFTNATNAMLDAPRRLVRVRAEESETRNRLLVEDTGVGVDLESAEELFKPFVRKLELSAERRALGLGGTGLGLTIVRLIADELGCRIRFVKPQHDFATAIEVSWRNA